MKTFGKIFFGVLAVPGGIFVAMFFYFLFNPDRTTLPDRIAQECQQSYGWRGSDAVAECKLRMIVRSATDMERERQDATYRRIR